MRTLAILALVLAGCGGKSASKSRCADAFVHLRSIDVFATGAAKLDALAFGLACTDLTDEDLACMNGVKTRDGVPSCKHAGVAVLATAVDLQHLGTQGGSAADAPAGVADAVCACADDACLVGLGESRGDAIRKAGPGP